MLDVFNILFGDAIELHGVVSDRGKGLDKICHFFLPIVFRALVQNFLDVLLAPIVRSLKVSSFEITCFALVPNGFKNVLRKEILFVDTLFCDDTATGRPRLIIYRIQEVIVANFFKGVDNFVGEMMVSHGRLSIGFVWLNYTRKRLKREEKILVISKIRGEDFENSY